MPKVNCSELAATIARLAFNFGAEPHVKGIDGVVAEMTKHIPEINRAEVVKAINEYTASNARTKSDLAKKLDALKREARRDTELRAAISGLQKNIAEGSQPPPPPPRTAPPDPIAKLQAERDALAKQVGAADPAKRDAVRKRIAELDAHIKAGTVPPPRPAPSAPADLAALRARRDAMLREAKRPALDDAARARVTARIAELEKHIAAGTEPGAKATRAAPADLAALRAKADALAAKIRAEGPSAEAALKGQIKELEAHIAAGTMPPKAPKKMPPERIAQLRARRDALRDTLARGDPARLKPIEDKIAELEKHLHDGTLPEPAARPGPPPDPLADALRVRREALMEAIRRSDPAIRKRYEADIARLTARLLSGDISLPEPKPRAALSKEAERLAYQRDRLRAQIRARINAMKPTSFWGRAADQAASALNMARVFQTIDAGSSVLRQGGLTVYSHPIIAARAIPKMFKAFSAEKSHAIHEGILNRDNAPQYARYGLRLADPEGLHAMTQAEEAFASKWVGKLPGLAGVQRSYTTFLNVARADLFDHLAATLPAGGELTAAEGKGLANYINASTGYTKLGSEATTKALVSIFFSPSYVTSRFRMLLGEPFVRAGSARMRRVIAKEYGKILAGLATVYGVGYATGGDVDWDPRSSDFGKIKYGNTRVDPLVGLSQTVVLLTRLVTGEKKTLDGKVQPLRQNLRPLNLFRGTPKNDKVPFGRDDAVDVVKEFLRTKLSPAGTFVAESLSGETVLGEPTTPARSALRMVIPISFEDIYGVMKEQGMTRGAILNILNQFGMGIQQFEDRKSKKKSITFP